MIATRAATPTQDITTIKVKAWIGSDKRKERRIFRKMTEQGWTLHTRHVTGWSKRVYLTFVRAAG